MKLGLLFASALALGSAACAGSSNADPPAEQIAFRPEPSVGGASIYLRGRSEGERVFVDVVARGLDDLHGAALRLTWDTSVLTFVDAQPSATWSKNAVRIAKEPLPGQLAIAWSERGGAAGHDTAKATVLGTLVFDTRSRAGTPIRFLTERSKVVDHEGKTLEATWRSGLVLAR